MHSGPIVVGGAHDSFDAHVVAGQLGELIFELFEVDPTLHIQPGAVDAVCMAVGMPTAFVMNVRLGWDVLDIRIGGGGGMFASADDFGDFAASAWAAFNQTGTMEVKVYQMGDRRMTVLAKCTFEVR